MPHVDLPLKELRNYRPVLDEPRDFDAFWRATLEENARYDGVEFRPVDTGLTLIETFDVEFAGYGGHPVKGWLHLPRGSDEPLPAVVQFLGYGGGRGLAHEETTWAHAGYAHFVMDTRGQGMKWRRSDSGDLDPAAGSPGEGRLTRGIQSPHEYVYRRIYIDAVHAIRATGTHPRVDPARIALAGKSQGGGIALAAGALHGGVAAALIDVPFLCHFRRAATIAANEPYLEIARHLRLHRGEVERVFQTLAYFDGVSFAARMTAPADFSVGLMDPVCPPSTVFAAFNAYAGTGTIEVYPFGEHEGGGADHVALQLRRLPEMLALRETGR